jgi:hypothetical protein
MAISHATTHDRGDLLTKKAVRRAMAKLVPMQLYSYRCDLNQI